MKKKMKVFHRNNTYDLCLCSDGRKPIDTKWVFKVKYDGEEKILKYKAHLVVKSFLQQYGIDYYKTYTPVVHLMSM
jgi:hypothetical protein